MRVVDIETLSDELRVIVVFGKDNRLAEPVAGRHLEPVRHQVFEHLVDCVGVEQPLIDGRSIDLRWDRAGLIPFDRIPLFLLLLGKVVIADAFADKPQRDRHRPGRDQDNHHLPPHRGRRRPSARRAAGRTADTCRGRPRPWAWR